MPGLRFYCHPFLLLRIKRCQVQNTAWQKEKTSNEKAVNESNPAQAQKQRRLFSQALRYDILLQATACRRIFE